MTIRRYNTSASAAFATVASTTSSTSLLASNNNRVSATIVNTDANALYIDLTGGTASATRCAAIVAQNGSYVVPAGYTGAVTGAWAVDGVGSALVTEVS